MCPLKKKKQAPCAICLDGYDTGDEPVQLECTHHFHKECISDWLNNKFQCPICVQNPRDAINLRKKRSLAGSMRLNTPIGSRTNSFVRSSANVSGRGSSIMEMGSTQDYLRLLEDDDRV